MHTYVCVYIYTHIYIAPQYVNNTVNYQNIITGGLLKKHPSELF